MIRINKFLASAGICSRRSADQLVQSGAVSINGKVVSVLGTVIDENSDIVTVNGKEVRLVEQKVYYMLNKPKGYVCTSKDEKDRKTVVGLIKTPLRIFTVGRLDYSTEGLLLLTNDGDFANKVVHPSSQIPKKYVATIENTINQITPEVVKKLSGKLDIGQGEFSDKAIVKKSAPNKLEITIFQGKNRQVRRMLEAVGLSVSLLKRVKIGSLALGGLGRGEYKALTKAQVNAVFEKVR